MPAIALEKIMKAVYALAVIAITFALAGCAPNIDKARAEYCKDLGAYAKTVAAVGALGPESTVSDFKKAERDEEEAYKKLTKAESRLSKAQDAAIRKVKESFEKTVSDIKGSEKLGAAATTVQQATAQALSQYSEIATTTCAYGATAEAEATAQEPSPTPAPPPQAQAPAPTPTPAPSAPAEPPAETPAPMAPAAPENQ
jgi:hypothetical protein